MKYINADSEFAHLKQDLLEIGICINMCAANEHIPVIEKGLKCSRKGIERLDMVYNTLVFQS